MESVEVVHVVDFLGEKGVLVPVEVLLPELILCLGDRI